MSLEKPQRSAGTQSLRAWIANPAQHSFLSRMQFAQRDNKSRMSRTDARRKPHFPSSSRARSIGPAAMGCLLEIGSHLELSTGRASQLRTHFSGFLRASVPPCELRIGHRGGDHHLANTSGCWRTLPLSLCGDAHLSQNELPVRRSESSRLVSRPRNSALSSPEPSATQRSSVAPCRDEPPR